MGLIGIVVLAVVVAVPIFVWMKRRRDKQELERYTIEPEALEKLLKSGAGVLVVDVRQPLDLLAYSEIIPGATRIAPKEIIENPGLIPREKDAVVYCTCPSDKTSLDIVKRGLALGLSNVRLLRGGLGAWKAKGFPVEHYDKSFRLDTAG